MQKYLVEFIGTFFLVLTIALAVASGSSLAPLAIGAGLMVMVYMGGHISGAHYNPAVTLAVFMRGKCSAADVGPYIAAQLLGAFTAAALGLFASQKVFFAQPAENVSPMLAIIMEAVWTFALVSVVLQVATHKKTSGNSYYGLAIGFTVLAGAVAVGPITGGAFNPAVGLGPAIYAKLFAGGNVPNSVFLIYTVGPFAGAAIAAIAFKVISGKDAD
jgi:aquaporin Z